MIFQSRHRFPSCNFPLIDLEQFTTFIDNRLAGGKATSFIRLGDGEGMLLARPSPKDRLLWERACLHFGPQITRKQINSLADMLTAAIKSADVVGVRDDLIGVDFHSNQFKLASNEFLSSFRASFKLRPVDTNLEYKHLLRIALLHKYLSKQRFEKSKRFSSAWLHHLLSSSGTLIRILRNQEHIGLISSKVQVPGLLKKNLNIEVDFYEVPEFYAIAAENGAALVHFPGEFEKTMDSLKVAFPGQLILVGAGICGKIYCNRIKNLGGIGLDIGSVCDSWINIPSRKAVYRDMYNQQGNTVPDELLLEFQLNRILN